MAELFKQIFHFCFGGVSLIFKPISSFFKVVFASLSSKQRQMTPKSKKKRKTGKKDEEGDMPDDVRRVKEKMEKENPGKTYTYRKAKADMPGIGEMLAYGAPDDQGHRSWLEAVGYPLLLALLFVGSFAIFMWVDPINNSKYPKGRFATPNAKRREHHQYQQQKEQQYQSKPVIITKKKQKDENDRSPHDEF